MAPLRIKGFLIWFHCRPRQDLMVDYTPIGVDAEGQEAPVKEYQAQASFEFDSIQDGLKRKLDRLADYARALLDIPEIELHGVPLRGSPMLGYYQVHAGPRLVVGYFASPGSRGWLSVSLTGERIPDGAQRLIENLFPMCEQLAWTDLHKRLGSGGASPDSRKHVLISYRSGSEERQKFVEAIAHRLGREGFMPWYDKWEIKAGDSIVRELNAGLENVAAIILVLTRDYPGERWARDEFETAITKRTQQGIRVIPVIYEQCDIPELLRPLRYADCSDHDEAQIERQFREVIDALNEIELNPYR